MLSDSTQWTGCAIMLILGIFISAPIQLISLIKFIRFFNSVNYTNHPVLSKVYPQITACMCIIGIIFSLLIHPFNIILKLSPITLPSMYYHLSYHSFIIMVHSVPILIATRYWLMLYQVNSTNSNINKRWRSYINPKSIQKDFWLNHHKTLGNKSFVIKIAMIVFIFTVITHSSIYIFTDLQNRNNYESNQFMFKVIGPSIFGIIQIVFYVKTSSILNNIFYFKYEMAVALIIFSVVFPLLVAVTSYLLYTHEIEQQRDDILAVTAECILELAVTAYMYLSSNWMLRKYRLYIDKNYVNIGSETDSYDSKSTSKCLTLMQVLCDEQYVELFVQHLCGEWKMNVILCFIELVQFKHVVGQLQDGVFNTNFANNVKEDTEDSYEYEKCLLWNNTSLPQSKIVYESNEHNSIEDMLEIAHKLYWKYLNNDCIAENEEDEGLTVNVSDIMRKCYDIDMNKSLEEFIRLENSKKNIDMMDLFEYFDPVIDEMYSSMQVSFIEFIKSSENQRKTSMRHMVTEEWSEDNSITNATVNKQDDWDFATISRI